MLKRGWFAVVPVVLSLAVAPAVAQAAEALVNTGSPSSPFPQNKQNEPTVAIDPNNPMVLAAGSNDEIDEGPCVGGDCPFVQGIGNSGIYFSFDGGTSWTQPTYTGWSDRTGTPGLGPIGTLPHYYEAGLVSDGDPVTVFGPRPDSSGHFSWSNGSRLYYANLTSNFATVRSEDTFKGFEAIAVSHADNLVSAAAGNAGAWGNPAIVTEQRQSETTFSDKEDITVDTASDTSPRFGTAYVCYTQFKSQKEIGPEQISVSHSTDGGDTWSRPIVISSAFASGQHPGRQGCSIRTDSLGNVYAVWEDNVQKQSVFKMAKSSDGGVSFGKASIIANVTDVGQFDGVRSVSFDGIAGARTSSFPSLQIANGAPTGVNATNKMALGWSDGSDGLNHEHALVQFSTNSGKNWTSPTPVEESGDRPDFAFIGLSPNGRDLYVVYDGFSDPFRDNTTDPRRFVGVTRHADVSGTSLSALSTLDRGAVGDARASSSNALIDEFIGDYNTVAATNGGAVSVFNDARDAGVCTDINTFRQQTVDGTAGDPPAVLGVCPATFGNTDIWSAAVTDPTP
jgi:hypothetical protein